MSARHIWKFARMWNEKDVRFSYHVYVCVYACVDSARIDAVLIWLNWIKLDFINEQWTTATQN